jgi:hypothetical protein
VIAFQATDPNNAAQVLTDASIGAGSTPQAFMDAKNFVDAVVQQAGTEDIKPSQIFVTGHSLGGAEAEYVRSKTPSLADLIHRVRSSCTFPIRNICGYTSPLRLDRASDPYLAGVKD